MKGDAILIFASFFVVCECLKDLLNDILPPADPDENRNVTQLIASKGYPVEDHTVLTEDGYLLSVQRIPQGRNSCTSQNHKKAVLLVHALFASADTYVINFPHQSLGFILADGEYDVWLGNTRGNTYSRRNVKYTPEQPAFWNFSFTEMGLYDLPAMIDYVLDATGEEKLYYIGHSQGTSAALAMLSERQEYNEKVKLCILLAPVAFVGHIRGGPLKYLAPYVDFITLLSKTFGIYELLPNDATHQFIKKLFCNPNTVDLCEDLIFQIISPDREELNKTRLPVYASHLPAGTSTKSITHYLQLINSKKFQKYDYKEHNVEHYQQATPPDFNLSAITAPIALFRGPSDLRTSPTDVAILRSKLKSVVSSNVVPYQPFNHVDFVLAIDANRLVYNKVIQLLNKY